MYVTAYPVLKNVKKIKLSPPKPGCMYPCLSDIEAESEVQESETEDFENNRYVFLTLTLFCFYFIKSKRQQLHCFLFHSLFIYLLSITQ